MSILVIPNTFATNTKAYASEVNENFSEVAGVVNGNIDSDNIADLGIGGDKIAGGAITTAKLATDSVDETIIADNAVRTVHIQDANVTKDKLANDAIVESKMNWDKTGGGVQALRTGPSTTAMGTYGLLACRVSKTVTPVSGPTNWTSVSIDLTSADSLDGNPQYTESPFVAGWAYYTTGVAGNRPVGFAVSAISASALTVQLLFGTVTPTNGTLYLLLIGKPTTG